ncbi:bifunctional diguanylate cyclase/phosphodiesterase [Geomonas limicola]|nr:EAL domain-containing protein [Geomonas limicola]
MPLFRNASIRSKLLAIMLVCSVPVLFVVTYFIVNQYLDKRKQSEREVLSAVQSIAFEHVAQVEGIRSLLIALSQYPDIRLKDQAGCSRILNLILEKSPTSLNVGLADTSGKIVATGLKQPLPIKYRVDDRKYFREALRTGKFSAGEYTVSRAALKKPTPTLHFALPVLGHEGKPEAVLYAAYDLNSFGRIFDAQGLPTGAIINLTDHRGTVLYRYSRLGVSDLVGTSDHPDLRQHMTGPAEEGVLTGIGMDGAKRHFGFKRLRLNPGETPYLYIRVSIPEQVATSNTRKAFLISLAVFSVAAVITYFLTRIIAGHYIVRPVRRLVNASKSVQDGDLTARSGLPYSSDELGQLARSFDEMAASLDQRIRQISQAESEKHRLAFYDPLTELPNRRLLRDRLQIAMLRSRRQSTGFALAYLDIDNFKHINDSLGHSAGDQLLKIVAGRYQAALREDDFVCRLGGDEFAVILHDIQQESAASTVIQKLLEATCAPMVIEGRELLITASIGVAFYPKDAEDTATLEKDADIALYHAKDEGKNTFRMFCEELTRSSRERINLIHALQHALDRNELCLHYQPKIDNANGKVTGVEALLRWTSPEVGSIPPDRFIPLAEESRLIIPIGEWVVRTACSQQVAWKRAGCDLSMAVNISAVQLKSPELIQTIQRIIEETGIEPEQLELELTESCLVDRPDEVIKVLEKLRALRCSIAIDDFGTGYSSLSYLKNFPVTVLKIDRSFVKDLTSSSSDRAIAQSVVNLANNLDMVTVAEGVEHQHQQAVLEEIGCNFVQGFLHCEPVPPEEIPDIVRARNGEEERVRKASIN